VHSGRPTAVPTREDRGIAGATKPVWRQQFDAGITKETLEIPHCNAMPAVALGWV